jgi:hypothetical protein
MQLFRNGNWRCLHHLLASSSRANKKMKSDVGRRGFAFVSGMTFPFDMAILNIKLKWKI